MVVVIELREDLAEEEGEVTVPLVLDGGAACGSLIYPSWKGNR